MRMNVFLRWKYKNIIIYGLKPLKSYFNIGFERFFKLVI